MRTLARSTRLPLFALLVVMGGVLAANVRTLGFVFWADSFEILRVHATLPGVAAIRMEWSDSRYVRPVWLASLVLLKNIFHAEPLGYHVTILVLHLASALLLYAGVRRLTRRRDLALMTTAAWTPLGWNAYTVSWAGPIVPEVIAAPMALLTLVLFWDRVTHNIDFRGALAVLAFALVVLTRETLAPFVGVLMLVAWSACRLSAGATLARTAPFWVILAAYAVLRVVLLGPNAIPLWLSGEQVATSSLGLRGVATVLIVFLLNYLRLLLFMVLPVPMIPLDMVGVGFVASMLLAFGGLGWLVAQRGLWREPERTLARIGAGWCLILALPYAAGSHPRLLYTVGMGLAMVLAAGLSTVVEQRSSLSPVAAAVLVAYLAMHAVAGWRVQDNFRAASPSTLAIYARDHELTQGTPPRDAFDVAIRAHVRDHLVKHGCLRGDAVAAACKTPPTYDLNDLVPRHRLGLALRRLLLGDR